MMKLYNPPRLLAILLLLLLPSVNFSQIIGTSAYIIGDNVEIGINDAGHEGAPRLVASHNRSNQAPASPVYFGFVANPQLDGWTNYDGDFFTPGSPENGFGFEKDGINYSNNARAGLEQIPGSITGYTTVGDCIFVDWDGEVAGIDVHIVYRLISTELYYTTEVTLTNESGVDVTDLYYYRNLDPDNNVTIGGGYGTQNTIVAQPTPECEKALVTAEQTGPWDSYIGLGAIGENFRVSYGGFSNRDASNIWNGVGGLTGTEGASVFADQAISLSYKIDALAAGEAETFLFTVVLDASQIDAAIASLYYFDYVGGGGVIDECAPIVDTAHTCAGLAVELTVDGPSSEDYVWSWSPPIGLSTTDGPTTEASPDVTTEYVVTGTPAPECLSATIEKTIVVEVDPSPIIEIIDPGPQCGEFDLTTLVINNLEGGPFILEYYADIPDSVGDPDVLWLSDFISVDDVVYVIMYGPDSSCYDVELIVIDFSGAAEAGLDNSSTLCNNPGSSIDMSTLLIGADPDGEWTEISWDLSDGFDPITAILDAEGVDPGDYTFEYIAIGLLGCEDDTALMTITINQEALAGLDSTEYLCNTDGTTIDLDDLLNGNNAIGIWLETTASGQFTPGTGVFDASGLGAGDYTFTYTVDALDPCVPDVADFTITIWPNPIIDAGEDDELCIGEEITLTGSGAGIGGLYTWDGWVTDGVAFEPTVTTNYTVTGEDVNGCINTDDVTITVNDLPEVEAGDDVEVCIGGDVVLTGSGAGIGGLYDWSGGGVDGVSFEPAITATYIVTGEDDNGCINTDEVTVTVHELPVIDAGDDIALCAGESYTLEGSGAGMDGEYDWTGGEIDGVSFIPLVTATYMVTGTDGNDCFNTDEVTITVNPLPIVDAGEDQEICFGESVLLSGAGAAVYDWTGGVVDGVAFIPPTTATYTVIGTDINDCFSSDEVTIIVNDLPEVNAGEDQIICLGETATLIGSGAVIYDWTDGVVDGVLFEPAATNTYTVTGTDANGCVNTDDVIVTVDALPIINAGADIDICIGDSHTLFGSGAGVGGSYTWDLGIIDGVSFIPGVTLSYTVTGRTSIGCENTDIVEVVVNPLPTVAFIGDTLKGCVPLYVSFSDLFGGASFDWSFGDGTTGTTSDPSHTFTGLGAFDVTLTITSADGCVNTTTYDNYINIMDTPIAAFSYSPDEIDISNTEVRFLNSSLYADTYEWSFGDGSALESTTDPNHEYPQIGDIYYNVNLIALNANGCQDKVEQVLKINDILLYWIPNAFTPDGDSYNESFKPVFVAGLDVYDYHMMVFNRWGELIFESFDANFGWSGIYGDGSLVDDGAYVWRIEFGETMSDKKHYVNGHVTVLK